MGEVTTVGLDIAKLVFPVQGVEAERPAGGRGEARSRCCATLERDPAVPSKPSSRNGLNGHGGRL